MATQILARTNKLITNNRRLIIMSASKQFKQCRFTDLIMERIVFQTPSDAKYILETMFPGSKVSVVAGENGKTKVTVGDAVMTIKSTK